MGIINDNNLFSDESSLLQRLTSSQIDDLALEYELREQGYRFIYAVDCDDVHKYLFPGDLDGKRFEKKKSGVINVELETDIQTAYDSFFESIGLDNPIFLGSEYIDELIALRDHMNYLLANQVPAFDYAKSFEGFLDAVNPDNEKQLLEDITMYIAVATGMDQEGRKRYNKLISNHHFILQNDETVSNETVSNIAASVFFSPYDADSSHVNLIESFFGEVRNTRSKRIDSMAFDRVIKTNRVLISEHSNERVLILFLSSSPTSTGVAQQLTDLLPHIRNKVFNFHRTSAHIFLSKLISDLSYKDKMERLQNAKKLTQMNEQQADIDLKLARYEGNSDPSNTFKGLRERYVTLNLSRNKQFQRCIELNNKLKDAKTYSRLKSLFNKISKEAESFGNERDSLKEIDIVEQNFVRQRLFGVALTSAIESLISSNRLRIVRGPDEIQGRGQHLPVVFLYEDTIMCKQFDQVAEFYLKEVSLLEKGVETEELTQRLTGIRNGILSGNYDDQTPGEKLLMCLYALMFWRGKSGDNLLIDVFRTLKKEITTYGDKSLHLDFLYTFGFVLRRACRFEEALQLVSEGLNLDRDDPRFYHSRFLIKASMKVKPEEFLEDIKFAKTEYPKILQNKSRLIFVNTLGTIINSELYAQAHIIASRSSMNGAIDELEALRAGLSALKTTMGPDYDTYPEFLHTEGYIEMLEAMCMTDKKTKELKLNHARRASLTGREVAFKFVNYDVTPFDELDRHIRQMMK
jgi:hypothetical protein